MYYLSSCVTPKKRIQIYKMNFSTFLYEEKGIFPVDLKDPRLKLIQENQFIKLIQENNYLFICEEIYSDNYPDQWVDQKENKKVGMTMPHKQLQEQLFVFIDTKGKNVYSNKDNKNKISELLKIIFNKDIRISQRLVSIEEFERKISKLLKITIKTRSMKLKHVFEVLWNTNNGIIPDLDAAENITLDISYRLSSKDKEISKMYKKIASFCDVDELIFEGSDKENIFIFNKDSLKHKIPIKVKKTGEGNVYDCKEVFELLKKSVNEK